MGLGPPVCRTCKVIGRLTEESDPRYGSKVQSGYSYWHCPNCGTTELDGNFWMYPIHEQGVIKFRSDYLKLLQKTDKSLKLDVDKKD